MKREEIFIEGVSDGATKFYKSITQHLKEKEAVIGNDDIGREALNSISGVTIASVKALGCMAVIFAETEDEKEAALYSDGVLAGTELFAETMKQLLHSQGHLCAEVLQEIWPTAIELIREHAIGVINETNTIH